MPYRRKDSPIWWVSFTDASGRRVRRSTGTAERKEAEALESKWRLEAYREKQWGEQPVKTFDDVILAYLENSRHQTPRTLATAKHLYDAFSGFQMEKLTVQDVRGYIRRREREGVKPSTINKELGMLSAAINDVRREYGWGIPNPVSGQRLREPEGRLPRLAIDQALQLVQLARATPRTQHLADFIQLALNNGMRKGEMLGLEWSRVDLDRSMLYLEPHHTKTRRRRSIPINSLAYEALNNRLRFRGEHCSSSPWVFVDKKGRRLQDVKTSFNRICRKAGLVDFHIHDLRHVCAAWLVSSGVGLPEVRDLFGHSTIKMTERYAHLAPENVRAAVRTLESGWSQTRHAVEVRKDTGLLLPVENNGAPDTI